jgi:hypothetical protein
MRIRLPELLEEHHTNAFALSRLSDGRLTPNTLYKLIAKKGAAKFLDAGTLQAIYDTLGLTSLDQLLAPTPSREKRKRRARAKVA